MIEVPFLDLRRQFEPIHESIVSSVGQVLDSCNYINGPDVKAFETELGEWLGYGQVVACSNATSGLFAVLKMLGVGAGDEVITTAHTAIPTAEAITLAGAEVVFSDILADTCNIDPEDVARHITPKTRAIIAVHLYGQPADLDSLAALARAHGLFLIEDCAQALGAEYRGARVGSTGDAAVFSFFPSKPLGCPGDGGAIVTQDPELLERIRMFCDHGRKSKYWHEFEGFNSRLDTIKAAMLRQALPYLDQWNAARRKAADYYQEHLQDIEEVDLPVVISEATPVWHIYAIRVADREALQDHLKRNGVATGVHYPWALNLLPAYARLGKGAGSYPVAEHHCAHTLSLPMFPVIREDELAHVCESIHSFYKKTDRLAN
jgi:dTDP-4-amino-4,6-dideoxygalactose transaminase